MSSLVNSDMKQFRNERSEKVEYFSISFFFYEILLNYIRTLTEEIGCQRRIEMPWNVPLFLIVSSVNLEFKYSVNFHFLR